MKRFTQFLPFLAIVTALGFLLAPLVGEGFFVSDDGEWMIIRLTAFFQSLREGQFPVRFLGRLNDSYGYPVANFLYPGYLYIGSFLHALGLSFVATVKTLFAGSLIVSSYFIYGWLKKYFKSLPSAMGTVAFLTLPYIGFDLYTRGSVGEILAFMGVAMCLFSIAHGKRSLFAISLFLLILAHNSLALLFSAFLGMYLLHEQKTKMFVVPFLLGVGMASFFWVPALFERSYTQFEAVSVAQSSAYFLAVDRFYLVASALLVSGLSLLSWARHKSISFFLWVAALALFLASSWSSVFWNFALLHRWFQFPFRFLALLAVAIPFLTAAVFELRPKRYAGVILGIFILMWSFDLSRTLFSFRPTSQPETLYMTNEATTTVQDEYLPRWASERPKERMPQRIVFYTGQGDIAPNEFASHTFRVTVSAKEDSVLQINTLFYPGWGVAIDNARVKVDYENSFGLMRVPVSAGIHTVDVFFRETLFRFIVDILAFVCMIFTVVFAWKEHRTGGRSIVKAKKK
jgi:hypothetical protein